MNTKSLSPHFPLIFILASLLLLFTDCFAQYRPPVFFREDWKESPPAIPLTQEHVSNKNLVLTIYGPGADSVKKSNHEKPVDDPYYVWSGLCEDNWAVTLKHTRSYVDLSEYAKIMWRSKQGGFRCLRVILKLADGTWLVGDQCDGASIDWRISEFNIADINWYQLNIDKVVEGRPVPQPDLTKVDEIGFTDLMRGGASISCSRLDWIEVYGKPVAR